MVCKRSTQLLGDVDAAERWDEPDEPRHPLAGIIHALERAGGPVLVCAADMPFVTTSACRELMAAAAAGGAANRGGPSRETCPRGSRPAGDPAPTPRADSALARDAPSATVATAGESVEPLLALYAPEALAALRAAPPDAPLRATIELLDPLRVDLPASVLRSVNTPEELAAAARELSGVPT